VPTSWLQDHLENFIMPHLLQSKFSSSKDQIRDSLARLTYSPVFTICEKTVMKNAWRSMKRHASGKKIILAGRDVWLFEVLARREKYPTLFLPNCSRASVRDIALDETENSCLFDTGFIGSIPRALNIEDFKLFSSRINEKQIFPRLSGARRLALKIEKTNKYWKTAYSSNGEVLQEFSGYFEFISAAALTIEIYKSSAPRFINSSSPIGGNRFHGWY